MARCDECGLPISVCNAFASYQYAITSYKKGDFEEALRYVESGTEFYDAAVKEARETRPHTEFFWTPPEPGEAIVGITNFKSVGCHCHFACALHRG